jgi:predicted DNA-binding protein (MmcQ/YjbR family)
MTWGMPNFRVGEKIFCGYDAEGGKPSIGFKLDDEVALEIVSDPRFFRAPNFGGDGWVGLRANTIRDWDEVRALVRESYRRCAPKPKES